MFLGNLHWGDDLKKQIFGPIISDPSTLWIPDGQTYDDGYEAGRRQGRWEALNEAADLVQNLFDKTALRELVKAELTKERG